MKTPSQKTDCSHCESRAQSLLCGLGDAALAKIDQTKLHNHFKSGQTLFYAGNPAAGIYCIVSGTVKLEAQDEEGKSQIVQIYSAGGMIGYRALFSEEPFQSSAIAVQDADVCFIPKATIMSLIKDNPELALKFLNQLSNDFRMMESRFNRSSTHSAPERVAEALLFLRENFQEKHWTRKEIADWAGTTAETVMRTLADFEEEGLIEQKGRVIHIKKRDQLLSKAKISV